MDKVARLSAAERSDLFQATAARRGMNPAVVEKDFWVCWVLRELFAHPELKTRLVFKGGTSLSKVYGLIERFSEDIDLVLDWQLLGYGQDDPRQTLPSMKKRKRYNEQINERAVKYIKSTFTTDLNRLFEKLSGISAVVDAEDLRAVNVTYPASFSEAYLRPQVRLEIVPLSSWIPSEHHSIQPYAAQEFPQIFNVADCPVTAIKAERTFWEKATILHKEAHRTTVIPSRYSRHYYDLHRLAGSPACDAALADLPLLCDVVDFKQRFYPAGWANYDVARPGSFRLIPTSERVAELRNDYRDMRVMIYGDVPSFDEILQSLDQLERRINELAPSEKR